jgi:Skp family chaperone for outer membrane proteins
MNKLKSLMIAIAIVIAPVAAVAPAASAQGTVVVVIDQGKILADSKAGKDMLTKLKNIETQINSELKGPADALSAERKTLATKVEGKTEQAVLADAALVTQIEGFQKKANDLAAKRQVLSQEFAATEQKAFVDFNKALEPVLLEVIKEKNAQVVLYKNQVVFSADNVDATAAVIAKLDQKTPSIAVVRQRAPAPTN